MNKYNNISCQLSWNSGSLNLLEHSGPVLGLDRDAFYSNIYTLVL